jgi:hypothetical protein
MILERSGKAFLGSILILCAFDDVSSRSTATQQTQCPRVTVSCASTNQTPYFFTASVTGAGANQSFSYQWTVSGAKLISGQGTPVIAVIGEPPFTGTVELKGLPSTCTAAVASCSILGGDHVPPIQQIDEFASIPFQRVQPRLDKLAVQLRNTPGSLGYIVSTGKWPFAKKAIRYFVSNHDLAPDRVIYLEKKRRGPLSIKLYLAPPGASPPG